MTQGDCCHQELPPSSHVEDEPDDNHDLDVNFDFDDLYSSKLDEICSPSLSPLWLPWSSTEVSKHDLLTACINQVDPASWALNAMKQ